MNTEKSKTKTNRICFSYARVSSVIQTTTDRTGIERQLETARRVAQDKGWTLDEKLSIADLGISGYTGKNLNDTAALGMLLKALRNGKIPPGRICILEALDRLTRAELNDAYDLLRDILKAGLEIYIDRGSRHYTKASLNNPIDLIIAIVELNAGHEYSAKLAERVSRAWKIKKQRATENGKPYRFKGPGWLIWNKDKNCYDLDPEKAKSIRRAFELASMGIGVRGITKRMNKEHCAVLSNYNGKKVKSGHWATSTVFKLLHEKKVLGYNENMNPPVLMWPPVVSEKLYYAARAKADLRKTNKYYGRGSDNPSSLFTGLTRCCKCNGSMVFTMFKKVITETTGSRGGQLAHSYLKCANIRSGMCSNSQLRADKMEESFAMMLSGSNFVNHYAETKPEQGSHLEELNGKIVDANKRLERYAADYEKSPSDMLAGLMNKTEIQAKELNQQLEEAKAATVGTSPLQETRDELLNMLYKGWTNIDVRLKLRELIRAVVDKIIVNGPEKCYTLYWKNKDTPPTKVELFRKAYKIDGILIPSRPDWQQEIVRAGEVIKTLEQDKADQPHWPQGTFAKLTAKK